MNRPADQSARTLANAPKQDLRTWIAQMEAADELQIVRGADLILAIGAAHDLQLVGSFHLGNPGAQVLLWGVGQGSGGLVGGAVHGGALSFRRRRAQARGASWRGRDRADTRRWC